MSSLIPTDIQARIQEAKSRLMAKVDEIRSRIGAPGILGAKKVGNPSLGYKSQGFLKLAQQGGIQQNIQTRVNKLRNTFPALKNMRLLQKRTLKTTPRTISKFTPTGPRQYVADLWFHNSHTKAGKEILAMGPGPLQKNNVIVAAVQPQVLSK